MTYEDYLQHWGILGMKWGQRNGPPYPLSSSQMNASEKKNNLAPSSSRKKVKDMTVDELNEEIARTKKQKELKDAQRELNKSSREAKKEEKEIDPKSTLKKKNPANMTDEELKAALQRAKNEKELSALNASNVTNGKRFVKAMLAVGGTVAITTFVTKVMKNWGEKNGQNFFDKVVNGKETKAKDLAEFQKKNDYEKAVREAKNNAYRMTGMGQTDNVKDYVSSIDQVNKLVNYFLENKGMDKYYK